MGGLKTRSHEGKMEGTEEIYSERENKDENPMENGLYPF